MVGDLAIDFPAYPHEEERQVAVYMRPHNLDIRREANGAASLPARVERINQAGSITKVTLQTSEQPEVLVDLSPERHAELDLACGEEVYIVPKKARVFVPDYTI